MKLDEDELFAYDDSDEDGDDTLNITLRTPPRANTGKDEFSHPSELSPPPELRLFHQDTLEETDPEADDFMPSRLTVPSSRRRTNSNYTLSSVRASRADSQASLTTISRGSSACTV